jgi:tetratricopeptide (TPR) repeat protein
VTKGVGLCVALFATAALAQMVPEREVEIIQSLYDAAKYAEAAKRATESLGLANFSDAQRVKLHEISGLSSFNLGDGKSAQAAFLQLLRINPDYILDPFAVPPPAIKLFDQVRRDNADALNLVRQQIALRADQEKRAREERERLAREQEERRRRQEQLSGEIVVRTIEKRSMLINFIPFGAGQFQQGRIGWGAAFAISEGIAAILSIVSYFAIEALYEVEPLVLTGYLTEDETGVITRNQRFIPERRVGEKNVWTALKFSTGIAFYALWALGAGDAVWRHQDEVITEKREPIAKQPTARLRIFPTNGGLGAGVTIGF